MVAVIKHFNIGNKHICYVCDNYISAVIGILNNEEITLSIDDNGYIYLNSEKLTISYCLSPNNTSNSFTKEESINNFLKSKYLKDILISKGYTFFKLNKL